MARNNRSGNIGFRARDSFKRKAPNASTPTVSEIRTDGCSNPTREDSIRPKTTPPSPTVARNAPSQSSGPVSARSRLSGTCQTEITSTTSAIGRLIKNTARQETCSINQPPSTGPIAVVMAENPDHVPIARPRCSESNDAPMIARLPGTSSAPPMPCTARATISWLMLVARPQPAEASAKIPTPMQKTRLRPRRSPSEPPNSNNAARKRE